MRYGLFLSKVKSYLCIVVFSHLLAIWVSALRDEGLGHFF